MRFTEFKIILEQETDVPVETGDIPQRDSYIVLVLFKNGERVRVGPIPTSVLQNADFRSQLETRLQVDYPDFELDNYYIEGPGGETYPITAISPVPDPEGELPPDSAESDKDDIGQVEPPEGGEETPPEETPPEETPPADSVTVGITTFEEYVLREYARRYNVTRTDDNDVWIGNDGAIWSDRETRTDQNITDLDLDDPEVIERFGVEEGLDDIPTNPTKEDIINAFEGSNAGSQGGDSQEGQQGEEGALTGDQEADIPSIIEQLRKSLRGVGTNETGVFNALRRIESTAHFEAVLEMYEERYGSKVQDHIISDYAYQPRLIVNIGQINNIIDKFGYRFFRVGPLGMGLEFREVTPGSVYTDQDDGVISEEGVGTYDPIRVAYQGTVYLVRPWPRDNGTYVSQVAVEGQDVDSEEINGFTVRDRNLIEEIENEISRRQQEAFGDKPDGVAPNNEQVYGDATFTVGGNSVSNIGMITIYMNGQRYAVTIDPLLPDGTASLDGEHYAVGPLGLFPPGRSGGAFGGPDAEIIKIDDQNIIDQITDFRNRQRNRSE